MSRSTDRNRTQDHDHDLNLEPEPSVSDGKSSLKLNRRGPRVGTRGVRPHTERWRTRGKGSAPTQEELTRSTETVDHKSIVRK